MQIPPRLKPGDEIRVLALSRSLAGAMNLYGFTESDVQFATSRLESLGLTVSFGRRVMECNEHLTASPQHRLEDLHEAIADPSVKAILAVVGGIGATQILDGIDYRQIKAHPKIICGYSDIGHLCNAIFARTGVVTYYGPHFTTFMMRLGADYTVYNFRQCLFTDSPLEVQPTDVWSDDAWNSDQQNRNFHKNDGFWAIQDGQAEGAIIGGNYFGLNMLQGSSYFPPLREGILFLEQPANGKATLMELDAGLRALSFQPEFPGVRAIVIGRYAQSGLVTQENLAELIRDIPALNHLPVIGNCDFGHVNPILTLPIGGRCQLQVSNGQASITLTEH